MKHLSGAVARPEPSFSLRRVGAEAIRLAQRLSGCFVLAHGGRKAGPQTQSPAQPPKPTLPLCGSFSKSRHGIVTKPKITRLQPFFPLRVFIQGPEQGLVFTQNKSDVVRSLKQQLQPPRGRCLRLAPLCQSFSGLSPKDAGPEGWMLTAHGAAPQPGQPAPSTQHTPWEPGKDAGGEVIPRGLSEHFVK